MANQRVIQESIASAVQSALNFVTNLLHEAEENYIYIGGIGSGKRPTFYNIDADRVECGCFTGTLAQFETQIQETHAKNPHYLTEYLGVLEFLKAARKARLQYPKPKEEAASANYWAHTAHYLVPQPQPLNQAVTAAQIGEAAQQAQCQQAQCQQAQCQQAQAPAGGRDRMPATSGAFPAPRLEGGV